MHVIISTHDPDRVAISRHSPAGPGNGRGRAVCQVDDTYGDGTNRRQVGAVTTAAQDGQSAAALHSDQHVRAGLGHGAHQRLGGEVPVQQHDHALAHAVEQARCIRRLAVGGRAEHRVDDRAGAAGHQHEQPQRRISRTTVVAAVLGERGQIRRAVGHRHGRAVDRADRQPFQARRQPLPHLPPAQPGEQTPGQQQIHHHPGRQIPHPFLHPARLRQRLIDHIERDKPGQLAQMAGRESPAATAISREMTDWAPNGAPAEE